MAVILTALVLLLFIAVCLVGIRYSVAPNPDFLSPEYSTVIKGLCSIVVVLVHVPAQYGNALQDAIGSFGYICVTLFFMFSGYGLKWSTVHKASYLKHFFRNRVVALMLPYLILRVVTTALGLSRGPADFVLVLLGFYIVFYIANTLLSRWRHLPDIVVCAAVLTYSLAGISADTHLLWTDEALGLIYGVLLVALSSAFVRAVDRHYVPIVGSLFITSVGLGILYVNYKHVWLAGDYVLRIALGLSLIALLLAATTRLRVGNRWSRFLGGISYEIFLVHALVMEVIGLALHGLPSGVFIVLTLTMTIIIATLFNAATKPIIGLIRAD